MSSLWWPLQPELPVGWRTGFGQPDLETCLLSIAAQLLTEISIVKKLMVENGLFQVLV